MNTNETKVDVLAVMDAAASRSQERAASIGGDSWIHQQSADAMRQARAAVAELIEADREYDEANSDWEEVTSIDPAETDDETWRLVSDRFEAAIMRRMNALYRIGGAK